MESRIEDLGLQRQGVAKRIGISRVQLWRALHEAVELSHEQLAQLETVLDVPQGALGSTPTGQWEPEPPGEGEEAPSETELGEFVSNMDRIVRTLRTMPSGPVGKPIKIAVLNATEQAAAETGAMLPREYYDIRRRVLAGEL